MADLDKQNPANQYEIAEAMDYGATPGTAPEQATTPGLEFTRVTADAAHKPIRKKGKRAIWVVHGMGQQLPFQTLDDVTSGLQRIIQLKNAKTLPPRLRNVKFGEQVVQRVELKVKDGDAEECELHLYEAYWAPMTEGVAKLSDVMGFLFDGGWRGLLNSFHKFQRAMLGGMEEFPKRGPATLEILATLGTVLALIVINAVIVTAGTLGKVPLLGGLAVGEQWPILTALASCMCSVALTFGTILFLAELSEPPELNAGWRVVISGVGWAGFGCTLLSIMLTAGIMLATLKIACVAAFLQEIQIAKVQGISTFLILVDALLVALALGYREAQRIKGEKLSNKLFLETLFAMSFFVQLAAIGLLGMAMICRLPEFDFSSRYLHWMSKPVWVWPFLIVLAANVRTLLVQYVGDVAIYITSNKLDSFDKVRKEIKKAAWDSANNVYGAIDSKTGDFEYEKVAIVGHSLGSVIAYDTLNRLLIDDELNGHKTGVADCTCLLETFGSPLDKTAFFFTLQGKTTFHIREQMASLVQPLIQKPRIFPWINVYSKNDIVSGSLFLYDKPDYKKLPADEQPKFPVCNLRDKQAVVPLAAHVDYWKNNLIWELLYDAVVLNRLPKNCE